MKLQHHGAKNGFTGTCHHLHLDKHDSLLIDSGIFQGEEVSEMYDASSGYWQWHVYMGSN